MKPQRRTVVQVVLISLILISARALYLRRLPERVLRGLPDQGTISHGSLYWVEGVSTAGNAVMSFPIKGGKSRVVARADAHHTVLWVREAATATDTSVIFELYPFIPRAQTAVTAGTFSGQGGMLGCFRRSARLSPAERAATITHQPPLNPTSSGLAPSSVHRLSRHGGEDIEVVRGVMGQVLASGDYIYWIKTGPDQQDLFTYRNTSWGELSGHSELRMKSIVGGEERVLRRGIVTGTSVAARPSGVFWIEANAYPDRSKDLYYYRIADGRTYTVRDYGGDEFLGEFGASVPLEAHDRLYWLDRRMKTERGDDPVTIRTTQLVSAHLDGSDRKTVLDLTARGQDSASDLLVYNGDMYLVLFTTPRIDAGATARLCRIRLNEHDPFEVIRQIPPQSGEYQVDEHSLYFTMRDEDRGPVQLLTGESASATVRYALYRVDLRR